MCSPATRPHRHMLLSQVEAASSPGDHHEGRLWQFSSLRHARKAVTACTHALTPHSHHGSASGVDERRPQTHVHGGRALVDLDRVETHFGHERHVLEGGVKEGEGGVKEGEGGGKEGEGGGKEGVKEGGGDATCSKYVRPFSMQMQLLR